VLLAVWSLLHAWGSANRWPNRSGIEKRRSTSRS